MFVLDGIGKEIQEANNLCWAAVATMAVRAFPEEGDFRHPKQRDIVIYRQSDIDTLAELDQARNVAGELKQKFEHFSHRCEAKGTCNFTSVELHMFDLKSRKVPPGKVLLPGHFHIEIGLRKRPVPIRWRFRGEFVVNGRRRVGEHALIVTGYNPITDELRIFDPGPAADPNDGIPDLTPEQHERWIPYKTYVDPQNDHGLDADAVHEFDEYMLQRVGDNRDLAAEFAYPDPAPIPPPVHRRENSVDFARQEIPDDLNDAIGKVMRAHVVRKSNGDVIHGPFTAGKPIPIVALKVSQILAAANDPAALFKSDTSTVAVPVLREREMVDSFMMLHDRSGWHAGGYCNNRIAALLLHAREVHGDQPCKPVYLVSIPEVSLFFCAHGYYTGASLAGLSRSHVRQLAGCHGIVKGLIDQVQREGLDLENLRSSFSSSQRSPRA